MSTLGVAYTLIDLSWYCRASLARQRAASRYRSHCRARARRRQSRARYSTRSVVPTFVLSFLHMIGSVEVLTISTQKWTFWVNSLTYLCCAERGQIFSDCLQNLNLGRVALPQLPKKYFFQKSFFFLEKNIFESRDTHKKNPRKA